MTSRRISPLRLRYLTLHAYPAPPEPSTLGLRAQEAEHVLARTDHTNNVLAVLITAAFIAGLAGIGFTGADAAFPALGRWLLVGALAVLVGAGWMLAGAITPRRSAPGRPPSGVPLYATLTPAQLIVLDRDEEGPAYLAERAVAVSCIAVSKHRRQRWALRLFLGSLGVMVAAALSVVLV